MFWDKGYTPSQNIEALLQKDNVAVEEFLDDEDILQECKTKRNLIQYLTRTDIIKRLIEIVTTEPPEDVSVIQRFKHANMACEILTFGLPSLDEKLVDNDDILQTLYSYLENKPPLNPLLSSFFSKTFSMLISKKTEQDWFLYQKMCLQVLEFIKSRGNFLDLIFKHFETPVIMDLLLQIIREVQGGALKKNLYEWLTEQKLVHRLISILGQPEESEKHKNVAEFLCDLIRHGRGMRQTDQQENDSFEPTFIGSNPLLQSIEDNEAISQLLDAMLLLGAKESTIIAGVQIILTLVDETIVDEPASDRALQLIMDKEKENHEKIVATIIEVIEPKLDSLHQLLLNPPVKTDIITTATKLSPPFGLTRLQICRLLTVLLRTNNCNIIDAISKTEFLNTLLKLFKEYCWNNFLHNEVEKCLQFIFNYNNINNNNDYDENNTDNIIKQENNDNELNDDSSSEIKNNLPTKDPSALQIYAIVNCRVISKLIDCWMFNKEMQSSEKGRRLGYMGHLIKIFHTITISISKSEQLGALIEANLLSDELKYWHLITDKLNGEFTNDLNTQNRMLANCNAYESYDLVKDYNSGNLFSQLTANLPDNLDDDHGNSLVNESTLDKLCEFFDGDNLINSLLSPSAGGDISLNLQRQLKVWDSMENDMDNNDVDLFQIPNDTGLHAFNISINPWGSDPFSGSGSGNPDDPSSVIQTGPIRAEAGWNNFMTDNFADFDAHFNSFANDLGSMGAMTVTDDNTRKNSINDETTTPITNTNTTTDLINHSPEITLIPDNNANIENILNDHNNKIIENLENTTLMNNKMPKDDNKLNQIHQDHLSNDVVMEGMITDSKINDNNDIKSIKSNGSLKDKDGVKSDVSDISIAGTEKSSADSSSSSEYTESNQTSDTSITGRSSRSTTATTTSATETTTTTTTTSEESSYESSSAEETS